MLTKHFQFPNAWENSVMVIAHGQVLKFALKPRGRHMISIRLEGGKGQTAARDYTIEHTIIYRPNVFNVRKDYQGSSKLAVTLDLLSRETNDCSEHIICVSTGCLFQEDVTVQLLILRGSEAL